MEEKYKAGMTAMVLLVLTFITGLVWYAFTFAGKDYDFFLALASVCFALAVVAILWYFGVFDFLYGIATRFWVISITIVGLLVWQWFMRDLTEKTVYVTIFVGFCMEVIRWLGHRKPHTRQ